MSRIVDATPEILETVPHPLFTSLFANIASLHYLLGNNCSLKIEDCAGEVINIDWNVGFGGQTKLNLNIENENQSIMEIQYQCIVGVTKILFTDCQTQTTRGIVIPVPDSPLQIPEGADQILYDSDVRSLTNYLHIIAENLRVEI